MCGIAGFLAKREGVDVAGSITGMLQSLFSRGPDSTGLSLYGAPHEGSHVASVWAGDDGGFSARECVLEAFDRQFVFAAVMARQGRDQVLLTGSCEIRDSAETAAVLAVLDATNRWMGPAAAQMVQASVNQMQVEERRGTGR